MALPLRSGTVPRCAACLRSYAFAGLWEIAGPAAGTRQQVRGKKRLPNNSATVTVRLLKGVKTYGRKGAFVPISRGAMRNDWFPRAVAEYVTAPELKVLRLNNVAMERDFEFPRKRPRDVDRASAALAGSQKDEARQVKRMSTEELQEASAFQKPSPSDLEKLSPARSAELVEIFIPPRLDFYRQPIIEEKVPEPVVEEKKRPQFSGAAGDLLAARMAGIKPTAAQAIYGSVSISDVLLAFREVMAINDEAARVVLHEEDAKFVDLPDLEGADADRVKYVGDFSVEVRVKGLEKPIRRMVRVIPQDG